MSVTLLSQAEPSSKENSESTVADFIVKHIIARQVTVVFGISGANIEDLFVRFSKHLPNIQTVVAKHEFNAVNMADGYAQTTGKLGVVLATSGGGALNLIPALAESHLNGTPLVVLVGQIGIDREGTGAFQDMSGSEWEIDAVKAFQPVCKAVFKIKSAEDFAHAFSSMVDRATEYPVGPIVILLPKDIQNQSVASIDSQSNVVDQNQDVEIAAQETIEPDIQQLAERLRQASFPVFIVGREINTAEAKSNLHHCVHAFSAKVVCAPDAKATFDNFSNSFCGVVGVMGHASAIATVMQSDMCIVIGTSLPEFCRMGIEAALKKVTVVHVSSHLLPVFVRRQLPLLTQFKVPVNEFLAQLAYCVPVHYDRKIEPHGRDSRSVNRLVKEPCTFSYKNIIGIIQDYIEVDANQQEQCQKPEGLTVPHLCSIT